jgi:phosphoglucosamine mutase
MSKLFGTDGIRGSADGDLRPDLVRRVATALAGAAREGVLGAPTSSSERLRVVVGRDTRPSGPRIESDLSDALREEGADVLLGGVLPTAAVAYLVASQEADAGVVVSASHNPPSDNGLKLFGPGGWKLGSAAEARLEELVASSEPRGGGDGRVGELADAQELYVAHLVSSVRGNLDGLRVVVDCAEGAASFCAPEALTRLGADVIELNSDGDGVRINESCGALHPEVIRDASRSKEALGLTFDGDADRVLMADEDGNLVDGDAIIALLAEAMRGEGSLTGGAVAVTVMANQALRQWCHQRDIRVRETPVGDRHVLEALRTEGLVLGGEQSGHVIRLDQSTTGDGILVGLGVLEAVFQSGRGLRDLVPFRPFPQVLVNVETSSRDGVASREAVRQAVAEAETKLGEEGRVLVRPSGTEPLVRVMVEATVEDVAAEVAERVAEAVRRSEKG